MEGAITEAFPKRPVVGVIGASNAPEPVLGIAEAVGIAIGNEGWHLLTGGGGGIMRAACLGFRRVPTGIRGVSIGILPSEEASFANEFVDVAIPTGIGLARNAIVARAAQAFVAVGGCAGTLSEIALAWQFNRPIAAMSESGGWAQKLAGTLVDERCDQPIFEAKTVADLIFFLKGKLP